MNKRLFAIVLCLTLLVSNLAPAAYAADADTAAETTPIATETDTSPSEQAAEPTTEEAEEIASEPADDVSASNDEPACSCTNESKPVMEHSDGCARKTYYKDLCGKTAAEIYAGWKGYPADGQDFILTYLSWTNQATLTELTALLNSDLSGADSVTVEDTTVAVSGIPQGGSLTVAAPSADAAAAVDSYITQQGKTQDAELFVWDISVQDMTDSDWQPTESVRVELEIPGVKLHKYDTVYVVHVDDNGTVTTIGAEVTGTNSIAFDTNGFSTFAGFTVDFAFEGAQFSIPGESSIKLSEVFDQLKMPLYVDDVANVTFTDTNLVTVTKDGNDWLLTSLVEFHTDEKLTVTMINGDVYEIDVTDATYVTISYNNSGNQDGGTLGVVEWYLDDSSSGGAAYSTETGYKSAPGWTEDYDIFIDGSNATDKDFEIVLQRHSYASGRTLYVDLHTIHIKGGANLTFRLGASITNKNTDTIVVRQVRGYHDDTYGDEWWFGEMFWVENGSLNLYVPYTAANKGGDGGNVHEGVQMVFDWDSGNNNNPSGNGPKALVSLRKDATGFKANQCVFQNTSEAAIVCRADDMDYFTMTACEFKNTNKTGGNGSGIYLMSNTADSKAGYTLIHKFTLTDCKFTNCQAGGYGGAMALIGYIHEGTISGCTFSGCTSQQHGGAIDLSGNIGKFTIQNSTFTDCNSKYRGGAVVIRSTKIKNDNDQERWTRSNSITFSGCTFTNCESKESHGGGIAVQGQLHTLTVSDCDFTNCKADVNGGAISIDGQDLPTTFAKDNAAATPNWAAALGCSTCTGYGSTMSGSFNWGTATAPEITSRINTISINSGCTFTNCSATGEIVTAADGTKSCSGGNGGSIEFAGGLYVTNSATISGATIDGSKSLGEGTAIFWSSCYVERMNLTDSTIKNCNYTNASSPGPGGTVKVTGNSCLTLSVSGCTFQNNQTHSNGGGLYWNAAKIINGKNPEATVYNCLFDGNTALNYGGGIYVESKISISKCNIRNNQAFMGGGIAQQVYNNAGARMLDAGGSTALKLDPQTWVHDNTANLGGGISIRANATASIANGNPIEYTVKFELNGAAVYNNKAIKNAEGEHGNGGGIYFKAETYSNADDQAEVDKYTKQILINQGTGTAAAVYNNTAANNGGGIYMDSSENTELRVQGGYISTNTAINGGGIYMTGKNATCYVEGGTIGGEGNDSQGKPLANHAIKAADNSGGNGGGIAISGGSTIQMSVLAGQTTGGTISYNTAATDGGGIWLAASTDGDTGRNKITIKEGSIIHNSANNNGGGISMKDYAYAKLEGGQVSHNTATANGGGIEAYYYADLEMSSGTIEDNTATNGSGGGIYSIWYGDITISGNSIIKGNHAAKGKGGGVFAQKYNVYITGGEITENNAESGGGVCIGSDPSSNWVTTISGGDIYKNEVTNRGGGIFNRGSTKFTVSGGNIYENKAYNGGGVYGDQGGSLTVSSGNIYKNTASFRGGGVYLLGSSIIMQGGSVHENKGPGSGGGICVMSNGNTGSSVTMSGGDIYKNSADNGWGGGIYMWGVNSFVSISGGNIYENTAGGCGGGVNAEYSSKVTISGGNIYKNESGEYGGGLQIYTSATATIQGGTISENTATVGGGGIALRNNATATFQSSTVDGKTTVGNITKNIAANGGGVYVTGGSELTVEDGFIINNFAKGIPDSSSDGYEQTAYQLNDTLLGVGGGIYVADGASGNPSTFTMGKDGTVEGRTLAIYGNQADFGADDVFANANNTDLTVPAVKNMDLTGYEFKVVGWFEDYPVNDTNYNIRLGNGLTARNSNVRYRGSEVSQRYEVEFVEAQPANEANAYVCMTLGIAGAIPDAVVIDFGLPVKIDILKNETVNPDLVSKVYVAALNTELPVFNESLSFNSTDCTGTYGKIEVNGEELIYTPNIDSHVGMAGTDRFSYALKYDTTVNNVEKTYYFYSHVTVIPATNIYYEDSFLDFEDSIADEKTASMGTWSVIANSSAVQAPDRPGELELPDLTAEELKALDADNVYGYDSSYSTCKEYSLGGVHSVTVNADTGTKDDAPKATFTFTGTGFDVVGLTNSDSGAIWVQVADQGGNPVKSYVVNTYYGYSYKLCKVVYTKLDGKWKLTHVEEAPAGADKQIAVKPDDAANGTKVEGIEYAWIVNPSASDCLYQVPVIKVTGLPHNTYTVTMKVVYLASMDMDLEDDDYTEVNGQKVSTGSYTVWLDAIRIYDPIDTTDSTEDSTIAKDAYEQDGESNPHYVNVKDLLVGSGSFTAGTTNNGVVYVDGKSSGVTIDEYANQGPNNETYLKNNNAIAFQIRYKGAAKPSINLQIGVKLAKGSSATLRCNGTAVVTDLATATNMFYKLGTQSWKQEGEYWVSNAIVLHCSADANSILSLTDLKITGSDAAAIEEMPATSTAGTLSLVCDEEVVETARKYLASSASEPEQFEINLAQVELGNALNLYFLFPADSYADWTGCYAVVTKTYADGRDDVTVTVPASEWDEKISGGKTLKRVGFHAIAAKEMGDAISITVYNANGEAISTPYSDSIVKYLTRMLEKNTDPEFRCLAVDMLVYGAAAQKQFHYNENNLVTAGLSAEQLEYGSINMDALSVNSQKKGDNFRGTSVSLENNIVMNVYFQNQTADMTATVTFRNHAGTQVTAKLTSTQTKNGYCFVVDQLAVADMTAMVTITCYDADGNLYGSVTDSVESYVARTGPWTEINQAILKLSGSAWTYLH